jgi:membrane-bound ClpP family serine protease
MQPPSPIGQQVTSTKQKPPVAAQILYALGFIGLIFGLLFTVLLLIGSSSIKLGLFGVGIKVVAIIYSAIIIFGFYLINQIHNGKKWALITYTVILVLSILNTVKAETSRRSLIFDLIPAALIFILWTKNKDFFS